MLFLQPSPRALARGSKCCPSAHAPPSIRPVRTLRSGMQQSSCNGTLRLHKNAHAHVRGSGLVAAAESESHEQGEQGGGLSLPQVTSVLWQAQNVWGKYAGKSGDDELDLEEAVELLNGPEMREVALTLFNVEPAHHTPESLQEKFEQADHDGSGHLSRTEFLALYLSVATSRVQTSPVVLAEALLGFIDHDRNGKIEGGELKVLLSILGFPLALALPIPDWAGIDYRGVLNTLKGSEE